MAGLNEALVARSLGPYRIGRKLGAGGMAAVYAAQQSGAHVKRLVALKILSQSISRDDPEHAAFLREAHVATRLEHPNIVRTYDVGEINGTLFLAMELVHGASLSACGKSPKGPPPLHVAVRLISDVARALQAAHELSDPERGLLGFVHQDVSPQNVLVGYDGHVKLVDFGVARLGALEGSRTETVRGKPSYLSPEQVNGKNIDRRTDIFALGIVFWEMLSGARLFKRETAAATYLAILHDDVPEVTSVNPKVPREIADVITKALDRSRERRFESADAFRRALASARVSAGIPDASVEDLAHWVREWVPPTSLPSDLEREILRDSRPDLSLASVSQPDPNDPTQIGMANAVVPDLDLPQSGSSPKLGVGPSLAPASSRAPVPSQAPASSRMPSAAPSSSRVIASRAPSAPAYPSHAPPSSRSIPAARTPSIDLATSNDDGFGEMEIERNFSASMSTATSSRPSGMHGQAPVRSVATGARMGSGLDIAHVRPTARSRVHEREGAPSSGARVAGFVVATVVAGGAAAALVKLAHHPGGRPIGSLLPHAFDGTSAPESGVVSLVAITLTIVVGFGGLKARPRSWALLASSAALFFLALAMVTVTLASTGENPTPPDGALLVPYLLPAAVFLFGAGIAGRAGHLFAQGTVARRLASVPVAALAGALLFVAYEASRLAQ